MDITFQNDPKLSVLLPIVYYAWQDDILTKKEFTAINTFIELTKKYSNLELIIRSPIPMYLRNRIKNHSNIWNLH